MSAGFVNIVDDKAHCFGMLDSKIITHIDNRQIYYKSLSDILRVLYPNQRAYPITIAVGIPKINDSRIILYIIM